MSESLLWGGDNDHAEREAAVMQNDAVSDGLESCAPKDLLIRAHRIKAMMPRVQYQRESCQLVVDAIESCKLYLVALEKFFEREPDAVDDFLGPLARLLDGYILAERRVKKGVDCSGMRAALRDASQDRRKFGEAKDNVDVAYRQIALKLNVRLLSMMPPNVPRIAIATHSFEGSALNDLRFKYGDRIQLTPPFDKANWWKGVVGAAGNKGYFPINYCLIAHPVLDDIEICRVKIKVWRSKPLTPVGRATIGGGESPFSNSASAAAKGTAPSSQDDGATAAEAAEGTADGGPPAKEDGAQGAAVNPAIAAVAAAASARRATIGSGIPIVTSATMEAVGAEQPTVMNPPSPSQASGNGTFGALPASPTPGSKPLPLPPSAGKASPSPALPQAPVQAPVQVPEPMPSSDGTAPVAGTDAPGDHGGGDGAGDAPGGEAPGGEDKPGNDWNPFA